MTSENPININISKETSSNNSSTYSEFKDYIIRNNITLQEENKKNIENIKDLENKILEYEENEDKYDTRMRYMKGLLQNINDLKEQNNKVIKKVDEKVKLYKNYHKQIEKLYFEVFLLLILIEFILLFISQINNISFKIKLINSIISLAIITFVVYKFKNSYKKISYEKKNLNDKLISLTNDINKINEDIKKTESSSITLDNWISEI